MKKTISITIGVILLFTLQSSAIILGTASTGSIMIPQAKESLRSALQSDTLTHKEARPFENLSGGEKAEISRNNRQTDVPDDFAHQTKQASVAIGAKKGLSGISMPEQNILLIYGVLMLFLSGWIRKAIK